MIFICAINKPLKESDQQVTFSKSDQVIKIQGDEDACAQPEAVVIPEIEYKLSDLTDTIAHAHDSLEINDVKEDLKAN